MDTSSITIFEFVLILTLLSAPFFLVSLPIQILLLAKYARLSSFRQLIVLLASMAAQVACTGVATLTFAWLSDGWLNDVFRVLGWSLIFVIIVAVGIAGGVALPWMVLARTKPLE
ncbi:MAG: hypothetical protein ACK4S4_10585 [Pyrinomonadaceae bacterium]